MASPEKPSASEDRISSPSLGMSPGDLVEKQSPDAKTTVLPESKTSNVGGSLPTTPTKLKDIDPAIISAVESSQGNHDQTEPGVTHLKRTASSSSIVTVKAWRPLENPETAKSVDAMLWRIYNGAAKSPTVSRSFGGPGRIDSDPDTAATLDSPRSPGEMSDDGSVFRSPTPRPRQDRDSARISAENAQGYFKASLCIFVANLDAKSSDQDLEAAVYKSFSRFGELWVKIRRDRNTMPYAFCQYTKEADAASALTRGHGIMILGRACRVELAKANRSIYVSRTAGGKITESEAREIFAAEGPLEKVWYPTDTDKEVYRLADGIWVTFTFFQDARDAQNNFKDSKDFRLEVPFSPEERERHRGSSYSLRAAPHQIVSPLSGRSARRIDRLISAKYGPGAGLEYENSIFIANLPENVTLEALRECFESCGIIRTIETVAKVSDSGMNTFAFIQFSNISGVWKATTSQMRIDGRLLRVEQREMNTGSAAANRRLMRMGSPRREPTTPQTPKPGRIPVKTPGPDTHGMVPITEGISQAQIQPQTPVNHPFYGHGVPFSPPPFSTLGGYYSPNQAEAGPGSISPFASQQAVMGPYPIPGFAPSAWSPTAYNYPLLYSGPAPGEMTAPNGSNSVDAPAATNFNDNSGAPSGSSHQQN